MRKFEVVSYYKDEGIQLPTRSTRDSAGYDIYPAIDFGLRPGETKVIPTGIKVQMEPGEVLLIFIRSSVGIKKQVTLTNGTGVIDADYYDNQNNEGHIMLALRNDGEKYFEASKKDRIAHGIFVKYLVTDDDEAAGERTGGIGSSGK